MPSLPSRRFGNSPLSTAIRFTKSKGDAKHANRASSRHADARRGAPGQPSRVVALASDREPVRGPNGRGEQRPTRSRAVGARPRMWEPTDPALAAIGGHAETSRRRGDLRRATDWPVAAESFWRSTALAWGARSTVETTALVRSHVSSRAFCGEAKRHHSCGWPPRAWHHIHPPRRARRDDCVLVFGGRQRADDESDDRRGSLPTLSRGRSDFARRP